MMNSIKIENGKLELLSQNDSIFIKHEIVGDISPILKIEINVLKDTSLTIESFHTKVSKVDIQIEVMDNTKFILYEKKKEEDLKIQYKYELGHDSKADIYKFLEGKKVKALDTIYLNGENAEFNYDMKGISLDKQKYNMVIYHNSPNTKSNISTKLVAVENGEIHTDMTSIVYPGIKDTTVIQNNRIINLNDKKHTISPNLLIEEHDINASHSAHIGTFDKNTLFYLMSRGITPKKAIFLLLNGFLANSFLSSKELSKVISQYWR